MTPPQADWTTHLSGMERALKALADAATEGPWRSSPGILESPYIVTGPVSQGIAQCVGHVGQDDEADAAFIAASREAVPMLLRAVAALRRSEPCSTREACIKTLTRVDGWLAAAGEWQDARAAGRSVEVEREIRYELADLLSRLTPPLTPEPVTA